MIKVCSFENFLGTIETKHIVCFGIGKYLHNLYSFKGNCDLMSKIDMLIDNSIEKQGDKYILGGKLYEIKPASAIKSLDPSKYVILITCLAEEALLKQLEGDEQFSKFDVYSLRVFNVLYNDYLALQKKIPENLHLYDIQLIPKKIHYCWFGRNPIPGKLKKYMESWHKYCPDYEIIEWNEDNYDVSKNKFMYDAYKAKKWGFVTDYARLDIVYNEGGIYLDTDVEIVNNIDDLLYQKAFMGMQDSYLVATGLGFGAMPKTKIIKTLRNSYEYLIFNENIMGEISCPKIQTNDLKKLGFIPNGECQVVGDLTIYPEKMLCGKSYGTMQVSLAPYTRMIHHFEGSWATPATMRDVKHRTKIFEKIES